MSASAARAAERVRLFVSYSHDNRAWFGRLRPVLTFNVEKPNVVHVWHDQNLEAGNPWDREIKRELQLMHVFICLLSYEFLASPYINDVEVRRALDRNKKGEVEILPILLFPIDLQKEHRALSKFNPLPAYGQCWSSYEENGGAYQNAHQPIRTGIRQAIERVKRRGSS